MPRASVFVGHIAARCMLGARVSRRRPLPTPPPRTTRLVWFLVLAQPFGTVCDLVAVAEEMQKLSAVCYRCRKDGAFSKRLSAETAVEVIGGADMYVPMCRACFLGAPEASGSVHITVGPMFSGKSSDLLRRIRRLEHSKQRCLVVKFHRDTRYSVVRGGG